MIYRAKDRVAIIGAGVSGLTCAVVFAERGYETAIFAADCPGETTSAVAGAMWYPYDAEPADKIVPWALRTYEMFRQLSGESRSGVSMIDLRTFCRGDDQLQVPPWAGNLGARSTAKNEFVMTVPLADTSIYLGYLQDRFTRAGGKMTAGLRFEDLTEVDGSFGIVVNCAGIGAKDLVPDPGLEPHRGQIVLVEKLDLPGAVVCDGPPLMYAIPRAHDCLFGGTNELSDDLDPDPAATEAIIAECATTLKIAPPRIIRSRVGLRPFRKSGVRLETGRLPDGRVLIHNYGHGGSGFTLSWGCAESVLDLVGRDSVDQRT